MSDLSDVEQRIRSAWQAGDFTQAATMLLESYRREIMSFLKMRLRGGTAAEDAFSMFSEAIWKGLPGFQWRCHARTWAYTVARNTANRYLASADERPRHHVALPTEGELPARERQRSVTRMYLRTTTKNEIRALREQLPMEDQELLVLRVERALPWRDLALTMSGDVSLDADAVEREAARLRKSFERIKLQLTKMAKDQGLLPSA